MLIGSFSAILNMVLVLILSTKTVDRVVYIHPGGGIDTWGKILFYTTSLAFLAYFLMRPPCRVCGRRV